MNDSKFSDTASNEQTNNYLLKNKFDWLKDGVNKNGDVDFMSDKTMNFGKFKGNWKCNATGAIWIQLNGFPDEYVLKLSGANMGEWTLVSPKRYPPTKMVV